MTRLTHVPTTCRKSKRVKKKRNDLRDLLHQIAADVGITLSNMTEETVNDFQQVVKCGNVVGKLELPLEDIEELIQRFNKAQESRLEGAFMCFVLPETVVVVAGMCNRVELGFNWTLQHIRAILYYRGHHLAINTSDDMPTIRRQASDFLERLHEQSELECCICMTSADEIAQGEFSVKGEPMIYCSMCSCLVCAWCWMENNKCPQCGAMVDAPIAESEAGVPLYSDIGAHL